MKFKIISILVWICLAVVVCGLVYQFGPPGIKPGDDRVLSSMRLQNGDLLYIVAHRTTSIVDTYEVCLYRVNQNTNFFVCFLGGKDSYWWGCSLRPDASSNSVLIHVFGMDVAKYSTTDGQVIWKDKTMGKFPSYRIDGVNVSWPVPAVVQEGKAAAR